MKILMWFMIFFILFWVASYISYEIVVYQSEKRGQNVAKEMGCEYLGYAYPRHEIKILDCGGAIVHIRVK
jgi:hypothetical protein